ncbi:MAG: EamA family transporter [Cyanobacteria bacterium QH_2_48_84]|nr:MAG: EamA family transporter [Cyanobacteria bacterium QH_2_48_84]
MIGNMGKSRVLAEAGFVVMWSSGFIGARLGTPEASTPTLMTWRFLLAAGVLLVLVSVLRRPLPPPREVALQGVLGLLAQGVYLGGVVGAVEFGVTAGISALVASLQPILAAALAGPILGERVVRWQWVGLAVGLTGVALVVCGDVQGGGEAPLWAYTMPFVGMAGLVAATLLGRKTTLTDTSLDVVLAIQCTASALLFAVLAQFWGGLEPVGGMHFWAAVAWFVVFSTFGGYGFYWLNLKLSGVARVSSLVYLTPPVTMVWSYLMFGESIRFGAAVGVVVCFGGVLLANQGR